MWGFWWVFPLLGLVMVIACGIMMVRAMSRGGGMSCMGGHRAGAGDSMDELRREVRGLREEVDQLKAGR
jgi:hypothetical protein